MDQLRFDKSPTQTQIIYYYTLDPCTERNYVCVCVAAILSFHDKQKKKKNGGDCHCTASDYKGDPLWRHARRITRY